MIEIEHSGYRLSIAPELGGAILKMTCGDRDVLRPTQADVTDMFQTSCFPLAPFVNRIAHGAFTFQGRAVRLTPTPGQEPNALHGDAWQAAWRVESREKGRARLVFEPTQDEWPWRYRCVQEFVADADGVRLILSLQNLSDTPMPASIGFHPYFMRPGAVLRANVSGVWRTDAILLPTILDPQLDLPDIASGADLAAAPFIDNSFTGWDGRAALEYPDFSIEILASPELPFLHLYVPTGEPHLCVEPVSAMPDAVNRADSAESGLRVLAPGETLTGWMRIAVSTK